MEERRGSARRDVRVALRLENLTARLAAERVLVDAGLTVVSGLPQADVAVVGDVDAATGSSARVLVVSAVPVWCARARSLVLDGTCAAAITEDDLSRIPAAVQAAYAGLAAFGPDLLQLAAAVPHLEARQVKVLSVLASGGSVPDVATRLRVSTATVKRELNALYAEMGVSSRVELVLVARRLGILDEQGRPTHAALAT